MISSEWQSITLCVKCEKGCAWHREVCPHCGHTKIGLAETYMVARRWINTTPPRKWWQFWIKKTGHWEYKK